MNMMTIYVYQIAAVAVLRWWLNAAYSMFIWFLMEMARAP